LLEHKLSFLSHLGISMHKGVVFSALLGLTLLVGCEESGGELGKPKNEQPGVHVKPTAEGKKDTPPNFADAMRVAPAYDAATGTLVVTLDIREGFHAYAPGEEIGKPVELKLAEGSAWAIEGAVSIPAGVKKDLGELGTSMILEGRVPVSAVVKGGSGEIAGAVEVQICTDNACDRPRKHPFTVPTT